MKTVKRQSVKCHSGLSGHRGKLQDNYDGWIEFETYSNMYNLHGRLGYDSPEAAWVDNPTIEWSTNPADFHKIDDR